MYQLHLSLKRFIRRFVKSDRGVAVIEFAFIMPFLITLYFGTIEGASLYSVDRRVAAVAGAMGDLVSRTNVTISTATLTQYFSAASGIMQPYATTDLTQVVSEISVSSTGVATVLWSRAYNGGTARIAGADYPLAATLQINLISRGSYLVVAEMQYPYKPVYGVVIPSTINLKHTEYFVPRFATKICIDATTC